MQKYFLCGHPPDIRNLRGVGDGRLARLVLCEEKDINRMSAAGNHERLASNVLQVSGDAHTGLL